MRRQDGLRNFHFAYVRPVRRREACLVQPVAFQDEIRLLLGMVSVGGGDGLCEFASVWTVGDGRFVGVWSCVVDGVRRCG